MMHAGGHALALPHLSPAIPLKLLISGHDAFVVPLTIALLEADVITNAMLRPPKNSPLIDVFGGLAARDLAMRGLSKWWDATIKANSCKFFRWSLHAQNLDATHAHQEYEDHAWFIFTRIDGASGIPRFALERNIELLEAKLEGFGQTVLAVLYDATMRLPESLTPWRAADMADYFHWRSTADDAELLAQVREENGYETDQEAIDNDGVLTREEFYRYMPRWVTNPQRIVSRDDICAARLNGFQISVVAACDAIAELVSRPGFTLHPADKGVYRTGQDTTEGSMVLLWREGDIVGQVIDDVINDFYNAGDATDFIDANPVPMTAAGIREFQDLTEQMMQLAVLTERLILLIGDRL
jgi:PRTRC genetic system protein F